MKTDIQSQMNAEKPDDVLADLEGKSGCASSTGSAAEQRESRKWWARVENAVKEVTGYSCKPHNPDTWWCPEVGYSLTEKYHLFLTEREALDKEIEATEEALAHETVRLANLKVRRRAA